MTGSENDDPRLADRDMLARTLAEAAGAAAAALMCVQRNERNVQVKQDGSPVCAADLLADKAAKAALARLLPGIPVISEESVSSEEPGRVFILLDPLDGTREFLADGDSYCVAIAAIKDGRPIAGAIAAPALGRLWFGGEHAYSQTLGADGLATGDAAAIGVRPLPGEGPVTLVSRFHGDRRSESIVRAIGASRELPMSSAVKFGLIASGEADLHVRIGQTMEWDIAAGDAIVAAAGGILLTLDGVVPSYGRSERQFRNPPFIAASSEALARRAIACDEAA